MHKGMDKPFAKVENADALSEAVITPSVEPTILIVPPVKEELDDSTIKIEPDDITIKIEPDMIKCEIRETSNDDGDVTVGYELEPLVSVKVELDDAEVS